MSIDSHGARLTRRDVSELAIASEQLAVAAETIRGMNPKWGEAVVNLLIAANTVIERVQSKGAAAFARYMAKNRSESPVPATEDEILEEKADQARKEWLGEPEE